MSLPPEKVIDFLYALKPSQWTQLASMSEFSSLSSEMAEVAEKASRINTFLGINISDAPWDVIKTGFFSITSGTATGSIILAMFIGILIPFLAWFTQWISMRLMPQQGNGNDQMSQQLKTMNTFMPLFSVYICLTLSMGLGIYWIFGAIVRVIQQIIINRSLSKIDIDEMMREAQEKAAAKAEKEEKARKEYAANVTQNARTNVKRIQNAKSNGKDIDSSQFYKRQRISTLTALQRRQTGSWLTMRKTAAIRRNNQEARTWIFWRYPQKLWMTPLQKHV